MKSRFNRVALVSRPQTESVGGTVREIAAFLRARGRDAEGSALLRELLRTAELVPKPARQSQAHWLAIARRELGA